MPRASGKQVSRENNLRLAQTGVFENFRVWRWVKRL